MKKINSIEKFLDFYRKKTNEEYAYKKVYEKPSKLKSGIYFAISVLMMILIIRFLLSPTLIFGIVFAIDLLCIMFFGYNLFSKKGFALGKTIRIKEDEKDE